jgi:hypothetical protein
VQREDIPYYCPTCDLRIKKEIRLKMSREKPAKQPKPNRTKKTARSGGTGTRKDGIKLKISLKQPSAKSRPKEVRPQLADRSGSSGREGYDDHHHHHAAGDSDDSLNGRPLIIDEIVPRTVKVGRIRRSSQRLGGLADRPSLGEEPTPLSQDSTEGLAHIDGHVDVFQQDQPEKTKEWAPIPQHDFAWRERLRQEEDDEDEDFKEEEVQVKDERVRLGEEEKFDTQDEEEMWLAAVEEGNLARLESVDSELRYAPLRPHRPRGTPPRYLGLTYVPAPCCSLVTTSPSWHSSAVFRVNLCTCSMLFH